MKRGFSMRGLFLGAFVLLTSLLLTTIHACSCSRPITLVSSFEQRDHANAAVVQVTLDEEVVFRKRNQKGKNKPNVFDTLEHQRVFLATARVAYKANGLVSNGENVSNPNTACQAMDAMLQPKGVPLLVRTPIQESLCGVTGLQVGTQWILSGSLTREKILKRAQKFKRHKPNKRKKKKTIKRRFKNKRQARKFLKKYKNRKLPVLDVGSCSYQAQVKDISEAQMSYLQSQRHCRCENVSSTCGALPELGLCPDDETLAGPPQACVYDKVADTCTWGPWTECPTCTADWQCVNNDAQQQYCAAGYCRAMGTCDTVWDCDNPSNDYATISCIGFTTCDDGVCGTNCDNDCLCPPTIGDDKETCGAVADCGGQDPCRESSCFVHGAQCVTNTCGEACTAVWYAPNGDQVCVT